MMTASRIPLNASCDSFATYCVLVDVVADPPAAAASCVQVSNIESIESYIVQVDPESVLHPVLPPA